jgi:hypothetical protein
MLFKRTPMVKHWQDTGDLLTVSRQCDVYLKLENTQVTGRLKTNFLIVVVVQFNIHDVSQAHNCDVY